MQEVALVDREPEGPKRPRPRPQRTRDPIIFWLTAAIFLVVILGLATLASALVFGVINTSGVPRTDVERSLAYYSGQVQSKKANGKTVALYVAALRQAGQLSKAQETLDQAMRNAKSQKSYLLAAQAQLDLAMQRYPETVRDADKAMAEARKELDDFKRANVAAKRKPNAGAVMPASFNDAALAKANALALDQKYADAVKAFDVYLEMSPTDSDILVLRAGTKIKAGDKKGAEADYRTALKFIPDYQPALDGLKRIGASK